MSPRNDTADLSENGFTLLEVLVGLLISSLILAGLSLAMGTVNRGYDQLGRAIDRQGTISTALAVFQDDISRIARVPLDPEKPVKFLFSGGPRELIYIMNERPGSNLAGLYWVRLSIGSVDGVSRLIRQRAPFQRPAPALDTIAWADEVVLIAGPMDISLSYRSPRGGLRNWAGSWEASNMLPAQIRIDVTDTATGRARVPPFTATLKIAAEAACADAEGLGCTIKTDGTLVANEAPQR
jgi:prepilin-type N-terminal cleavage/methylation domain-containing protein